MECTEDEWEDRKPQNFDWKARILCLPNSVDFFVGIKLKLRNDFNLVLS